MDNVVKFPNAPEWATAVDAKMRDWLIARGYLQHHQRHDWRAVEMAVNSVFGPFDKAAWHKLGELQHEIERVRRRINSA
jgi:hypothetical protein